MLGFKTKIIAISAAVALIAAPAVAVWSASRKIDRLQTELQTQRAATQSAQTALAVESASYQSYRRAAEQSAAALQSAAAIQTLFHAGSGRVVGPTECTSPRPSHRIQPSQALRACT